ncbi:MAG: winged helix-turn-helix domain-containing protein [Alphaproteobacteria bacterium]|nr:winged helix-turn-helix domain-containing protein [Alphaproteobacteria bacterium]
MDVVDPWYEAETRTAHLAGRQVVLTDKEGEAFAYLCGRLGQIVGREELEREVWQMAPGVRSETVPVTLRNLRRKLGDEGDSALHTVRGVGWRLDAVERVAPSSLPRFATPYFGRDAEESAVLKLLEGPWPVVTLVGPGGIGKSRLAAAIASRLKERVVFVAVSEGMDADALGAALLGAAGVNARRMDELAASLGTSRVRIVLDEAEQSWEAARDFVARLPELRFLVTSRRELGVAGEAVHDVRPLTGDEGRRFLRERLEASRWHRGAADPELDRAIELLDGLPLGLELVAAHPDPVESQLDDLAHGSLPEGPEAERLEAALRRSFERLAEPARALLLALSLPEGPVSDDEIRAWLGPEAIAGVRDLAQRSLVDRQGTRWVLLRTQRTFLLRQHGPWDALRERFDAFLHARLFELEVLLLRDPSHFGEAFAPRIEDLVRLLERCPLDDLVEATWTLGTLYDIHGPRIAQSRLLEICERRLIVHPMLPVLEAVVRGSPRGQLPEPPPGTDLTTRTVTELLRSNFARESLDLARLDAMLAEVPPGRPVFRHRIQRLRALALDFVDPDASRALMLDMLRDADPFPTLRPEILSRLAFLHRAQLDVATRFARRAVDEARRCGLAIQETRCRWVLSAVLTEQDPELGAEAYLESAAASAVTAPREADALASVAGLMLFALGHDDRAVPLLERGLAGIDTVRGPSEAALSAIRLSRGDTSAKPALRRADPRHFLLYRENGSFAGGVARDAICAEVEVHDAMAEGREREAIAAVVARLEAVASPGDPVLLDLLRKRWAARLERQEPGAR